MQAQRREEEELARSLHHAAIECVYRAGVGEVEWPEALVMLLRAHGADGAMLFTPEMPRESGGLSVCVDINARGGLRAVPADLDVPRPTTGRAFSTVLDIVGHEALPATLFLLFRSESAPPLADDELEALQVTCRHLSLAVRLWFRERLSRGGAEAVVSSICAGTLIAHEDGRIAWLNRRAEAWVRERRIAVADGKILNVSGLPADVPRAVREAVNAGSRVAFAEAAMTLEVAPILMPNAGGTGGLERMAFIVVRDGAGAREAAASLAANYRLTTTEVDLAIALWKGTLIAEYATQRSVAMSTVRTQLKALLAKTGSRRQSDIVALVARLQPLASVPRLGDDGGSRHRRD